MHLENLKARGDVTKAFVAHHADGKSLKDFMNGFPTAKGKKTAVDLDNNGDADRMLRDWARAK